jgi:hypothetical protein
MDIPQAIKSVSTAIDIAKNASNAVKSLENATINNAFADILLELANIKNILVDEKEENLKLKEENLELKKEIKLINENNAKKAEFIEKNGLFFSKDDPDNPFCPNCLHSEKSYPIKLVKLAGNANFFGNYSKCPKCNQQFAYKIR